MNNALSSHEQVRIHIDQRAYNSPSPTTGAALYALAQIGPELRLFREVSGDREDRVIPPDGHELRLHNDEHFHSGPAVSIFVNTISFQWDKPKITHDEVVKLAFPHGPFGADIKYSVLWTMLDGREGSLRDGQRVEVEAGMIFDVRNADKS